jgi:hypothetical protein
MVSQQAKKFQRKRESQERDISLSDEAMKKYYDFPIWVRDTQRTNKEGK